MILLDENGYNQYLEELNKLKEISIKNSTIGSESYKDAVGDGWHDNFAFEETMRESRLISNRINKMIQEQEKISIVKRNNISNDIIDIGDILTIKVIYSEEDTETLNIKLTGKYLPKKDSNEITLNSPIGKAIYQKNINDNIYYLVNDKKIIIKVIDKKHE